MDIDILILKFIQKGIRSRIFNTILKEKNEVGGQTLPNFKTYCKDKAIKAVQYRQRNRQIEQQNRIRSSEIDPHKYNQLTFDKRAKAIQWSKDSLFNKLYWNKQTPKCKKKEK